MKYDPFGRGLELFVSSLHELVEEYDGYLHDVDEFLKQELEEILDEIKRG